MHSNHLREDLDRLLVRLDGERDDQEPDAETGQPPEDTDGMSQAPEEIQDLYVLVVRERDTAPENAQVIESVPPKTESDHQPEYVARVLLSFGILLALSCILLQVYLAYNPPTAIVTIKPKAQLVTLTGTLHLGRLFHPITLSQSQTVLTTGKGHQDATQAHGTITLYNGLFTSQTVATGTILRGSDGVQVITEQDAVLPAGNPPTYGQASVAANALVSGTRGNIPAYDITHACCAVSVLAKNTQPWTGGQDERDYHTVAQSDIVRAASPLQMTLAQSVSGAFQGQLKPNEQLYILPCTPSVMSDHLPGEEATQVHVNVSETCSAVAYDKDALQAQATALLSTQAATRLGTGYSLMGDVHVTVKQVTVTVTPHPTPVVFSFNVLGTWVYAVKSAEQQRIKSLIAGKTKQEAEQLLASMPGIEQASIRWADETKLPKDTAYIRVVGMYGI